MGRKTHCYDRVHERNYFSDDITGQKFNRVTALYTAEERDKIGSVWLQAVPYEPAIKKAAAV